MEILTVLIQAALLMTCPIMCVMSEVTSTKTEIVVETVTNTIVAIGGVIQSVIVKLDNGNGHLWDYSTMLVTGEQVLTIVPSTVTSCATIYMYSDVTLSSETTLLTPPVKRSEVTGLKHLLPNAHPEPAKEEQEKINEIIDRMVRSAADLSHIKLAQQESDEYEQVISI